MSKELTTQHWAQTRRAFIGQGAFAFLAAAGMGHRAFGATGTARLRFGALSDIHIRRGKGSCDIFEKALTYFRDQKVDAVLIAGDLADSGLDSQLRRVGETWRRVFPDDRRPDGEHVEKIFVTGNHDFEGWRYGAARKFGITKEKDGNDILSLHMAEGWKRAFDEDYAPMYVKTVKGYKFVGVHYDPDGGYHKEGAIAAFLESHRDELAGSKPFFYTQHFHPQGTCSAPWAWGEDKGYSTAALSVFPNAVSFTGHSHTPITDDRTLWRGAFTSVGTASLRFLVLFGGRENSSIWGEKGLDLHQQMPALTGRDAQQGQLVTVYDDRIVLERRDFANDLPAAPDWIVPLPAHASSFAERAKEAPVPEFSAGAEVTVERIKGKNRANEETEQFVVSFPNVKGLAGGAHAFDFQVTVEAEEVDRPKIWVTKRVYSPHFYWAAEKDDDTVTCVFACSELPAPNKVPTERGRRFRFAVAPANSFGGHGKAIRSDWLTGNFGAQ